MDQHLAEAKRLANKLKNVQKTGERHLQRAAAAFKELEDIRSELA